MFHRRIVFSLRKWANSQYRKPLVLRGARQVGKTTINDSVLAQRNFWVRDAKNSQAELDFVIQTESQIVPIEVKSGHNAKIKSMHLFMEAAKHDFAIRFWNNPMQKDIIELQSGKKYTLLNLPFYYAEVLDSILNMNLLENTELVNNP